MRRPTALLAALAMVTTTLAMPARPALAATITVNSTSFTPTRRDCQGPLIEAMENARNANQGYPDCAAGAAGGNVIQLQAGMTYAVPRAWTNAGKPAAIGLPVVTRALTINGNGAMLTRTADSGAFRLLYVVNASLTLDDLTVKDIVLPEQADGAVCNDTGTLTINRGTFTGMRGLPGATGTGAPSSSTRTLASPPATSRPAAARATPAPTPTAPHKARRRMATRATSSPTHRASGGRSAIRSDCTVPGCPALSGRPSTCMVAAMPEPESRANVAMVSCLASGAWPRYTVRRG